MANYEAWGFRALLVILTASLVGQACWGNLKQTTKMMQQQTQTQSQISHGIPSLQTEAHWGARRLQQQAKQADFQCQYGDQPGHWNKTAAMGKKWMAVNPRCPLRNYISAALDVNCIGPP